MGRIGTVDPEAVDEIAAPNAARSSPPEDPVILEA
jgi:hypothetical protein